MDKKSRTILGIGIALAIIGLAIFFSKDSQFTIGNTTPVETATPAPAPTIKPSEKVSFVAAGDNLIHGMIYLQAAARAKQDSGDKYDFSYVYENSRYYFEDFDIKFINQETLVNDAFEPSTYPLFSSPIELGKQVLDVGFNAIGMSNNHSYDKGSEGIRSSLDFWRNQNDIEYFGLYTGNDDKDIKYIEKNGVKVAFLAYTSYTNGLSIYDETSPKIIFTDQYDVIERQIKKAKENADIVIVSCHWGYEDTNNTIPQQTEIATKLCEFGADAIIGTHPHVIQTVEWLTNDVNDNKTIVCYSLGNFISAQSAANNMLGGLFQFDIIKTYTDIEGNYKTEIKNPYFVPTVTHYGYNYSNVTNYLLKDYTQEKAQTHGVRAFNDYFNLEFMENIIYKYIPSEFLKYK